MYVPFLAGRLPAKVVVRAGNVTAAPVAGALATLQREALATGQMSQPVTVLVSPGNSAAVVSIPLAGNVDDAPSKAALRTLRDRVIPSVFGNLAGVTVAVTGYTASVGDFKA